MFGMIFTIWILALPFIFFNNMYEGVKVITFWVGSFTLIIYWLVCKRKGFIQVLDRWDVWYWAWILVIVVSSLTGIDPLKSIIGGGYRHQGLVFFVSLWLVGKSILLLDKKYRKILSKGFMTVVTIEILVVILQKALNITLINYRPIGTFGEPNAVAGFINIGIFFSQNIYFVLFIFVSNLILQSRSGILMFLILTIPFLVKKKPTLFLVFIIVATVFTSHFTNLRNVYNKYNFEDRVKYFEVALTAISKRPILGYGLESIDIVFKNEFRSKGINLEDLIIDRSHNIILDILIWSGILGLVPFLIWLTGNLIETFKLKDYRKLVSVVAILLFGFFQPIWVVHWVMLFLLINWRS